MQPSWLCLLACAWVWRSTLKMEGTVRPWKSTEPSETRTQSSRVAQTGTPGGVVEKVHQEVLARFRLKTHTNRLVGKISADAVCLC